jgi:7-cyano-7-deazaguanine reductase
MAEFRHLGKKSTEPIDRIDRIDWQGGPIHVRLDCTEFSALCPVTGQPDYGRLTIEYVPNRHLVETKSLKLYLWRYRNERAFNETLVDTIAADLYKQLEPRWLKVVGAFNMRGGIAVTATAERGEREATNP